MNFDKYIWLCNPICIKIQNMTSFHLPVIPFAHHPLEATAVQISLHHWLVLPAVELRRSGIILGTLLCSTVFHHKGLSCIRVG